MRHNTPIRTHTTHIHTQHTHVSQTQHVTQHAEIKRNTDTQHTHKTHYGRLCVSLTPRAVSSTSQLREARGTVGSSAQLVSLQATERPASPPTPMSSPPRRDMMLPEARSMPVESVYLFGKQLGKVQKTYTHTHTTTRSNHTHTLHTTLWSTQRSVLTPHQGLLCDRVRGDAQAVADARGAEGDP